MSPTLKHCAMIIRVCELGWRLTGDPLGSTLSVSLHVYCSQQTTVLQDMYIKQIHSSTTTATKKKRGIIVPGIVKNINSTIILHQSSSKSRAPLFTVISSSFSIPLSSLLISSNAGLAVMLHGNKLHKIVLRVTNG